MSEMLGNSKILLALLAALLLSACATTHGPLGDISEVVVLENGGSDAVAVCQDFKLSSRQVKRFIDRAVVITPSQEHDHFNHGPCYVRGTLSANYGMWNWEILNLGTGTLTSGTDETIFIADPKQESSLADE